MSEFFLDLNAVNEEVEKAKNSGGSDKYFSRKDIKDNTSINIRVMPPVKSMNGLPYVKRTRVWMNKKPYLSPRTFGEPCIILDAYDAILAGDNQDLKALVTDDKHFSIAEDYVLPILLLNVKYKSDNSLEAIEVVDDKVKMFDCTWTFIKGLNLALSNRLYQNGSPLGLMDRVLGRNLQVTKEVTQKTSYNSIVWPGVTEMPEKYYNNMIDVVAEMRNSVYQKVYIEGMLNSYLFGKPAPSEDLKYLPKSQAAQGQSVQNAQPIAQAPTSVVPPATTQPAAVTTTAPPSPPTSNGGETSLLDLLNKSK